MPRMTFKFNRAIRASILPPRGKSRKAEFFVVARQPGAAQAAPGTPGARAAQADGGEAPAAFDPWVNEGALDAPHDDDDVPAYDGIEPSAIDSTIGGELKLMQSPDKVAKVAIGYALAAKTVDVKGLKHSMWQHVEANTHEPKAPLLYVPMTLHHPRLICSLV